MCEYHTLLFGVVRSKLQGEEPKYEEMTDVREQRWRPY